MLVKKESKPFNIELKVKLQTFCKLLCYKLLHIHDIRNDLNKAEF